MVEADVMIWQRARFRRIWALLALVWVAGVTVLFYGDLTKANVAAQTPPATGEVPTAEGEATRGSVTEITMTSTEGALDRSVTRTAMVALMPPAGTLMTGLILGWFVSRPKRNTQV